MRIDRKRIQMVREYLAEMGVELTPDDLAENINTAYTKIRDEMRAKGHEMPDGPEEFRRQMLDDTDVRAVLDKMLDEKLERRGFNP